MSSLVFAVVIIRIKTLCIAYKSEYSVRWVSVVKCYFVVLCWPRVYCLCSKNSYTAHSLTCIINFIIKIVYTFTLLSKWSINCSIKIQNSVSRTTRKICISVVAPNFLFDLYVVQQMGRKKKRRNKKYIAHNMNARYQKSYSGCKARQNK